ncbi:hypothetical protein M1O16_04995 [Dehalococcoidia bacterium]|nr:hypothetical protein [Dehalococcoidia bacterium]
MQARTSTSLWFFPKGALLASGETSHFDTNREIRLGIENTRERIIELLGTDVRTVESGESWDLVAKSTRNTMAWRNISMLLDYNTSFPYFHVPPVLLDSETPADLKREFVRGYADVAGNIRPANRDQAGRHRVRLDTLNYQSNWIVPVQLCLMLQDHLGVSIPVITWGHPNLGREWREHQLNVYAEDFLKVGFFFEYKQKALEEMANLNQLRFTNRVRGCPGKRRLGRQKPPNNEENNTARLDSALVGKHFDGYWHICKVLGCLREPSPGEQLELPLEE